MIDLGNKLKALRENKGFTQEQLASRLWTSKSAISSYETGMRRPNYEMLIKIAALFGVSTDWLLGADEVMGSKSMEFTDEQRDILNRLIAEFQKTNNM